MNLEFTLITTTLNFHLYMDHPIIKDVTIFQHLVINIINAQ
jgi:hypothetical protein